MIKNYPNPSPSFGPFAIKGSLAVCVLQFLCTPPFPPPFWFSMSYSRPCAFVSLASMKRMSCNTSCFFLTSVTLFLFNRLLIFYFFTSKVFFLPLPFLSNGCKVQIWGSPRACCLPSHPGRDLCMNVRRRLLGGAPSAYHNSRLYYVRLSFFTTHFQRFRVSSFSAPGLFNFISLAGLGHLFPFSSPCSIHRRIPGMPSQKILDNQN